MKADDLQVDDDPNPLFVESSKTFGEKPGVLPGYSRLSAYTTEGNRREPHR